MREQLTNISRAISNQARSASTGVSAAVGRVRGISAGATAAAMRHVTPALRWSGRQSKRAAIGTLVTVENALLSPRGRDRIHASTVFALIFAFGVLSVDTLVTGGPEIISSAQASTISTTPRVDLIAATSLPAGDVVQFAAVNTAPPTPAEPEVAGLRPVSLTVADAPRIVGPVPELVDAAPAPEPVKASPIVREGADGPVKAEGEA